MKETLLLPLTDDVCLIYHAFPSFRKNTFRNGEIACTITTYRRHTRTRERKRNLLKIDENRCFLCFFHFFFFISEENTCFLKRVRRLRLVNKWKETITRVGKEYILWKKKLIDENESIFMGYWVIENL